MTHAKSGKRVKPAAKETAVRPAVPSAVPRAALPARKHAVVAAVCAGLVLACIAIYGQTLWFDFVNYDDSLYVTENPTVQAGLALKSVRWAFVTEKALYFHPLTWMSLMLDHDLYGMRAGGYHLTNLILHAAAAVLLFLTLRRMTGALWPSAAVAALFAVHPLNTESVAWIAERKGVLSGFFWMLALFAYGPYARRGGALRYAAVAAAFAGGVMSKPMVVTLPFALLLLDCWPLGRVDATAPFCVTAKKAARMAMEKIPLFLITALSALSTFVMQTRGGNVDVSGKIPLLLRFENAMIVYVLYLVKAVWPSGLAAYYPYPSAYPLWQAGGAFLALAAITLFCLGQARRRPYLIVGWLWYLGTFAPVIGLVRIGSFSHADRYTYLPMVGVFIMVAWGAADLARAWRVPKSAAATVTVAAVAALSVCAGIQTQCWRDSVSLFSHAIAAGQESSAAYGGRGKIAMDRGHYDEARDDLAKALALRPDDIVVLINLGKLALLEKRYDDAEIYLKRVLQIRPDSVLAFNNLSALSMFRGRHSEAEAFLKKALELDPEDGGALSNLGACYIYQGKYAEAERCLIQALKVSPRNAEALKNLGIALGKLGRREESEEYLKRAAGAGQSPAGK